MERIPHILLPPNSVNLYKISEVQDWNRIKKVNGCVWISLLPKQRPEFDQSSEFGPEGRALPVLGGLESRRSQSREQFPDVWGGVRRDEGKKPHRSPALICALREGGAPQHC